MTIKRGDGFAYRNLLSFGVVLREPDAHGMCIVKFQSGLIGTVRAEDVTLGKEVVGRYEVVR